MHVIKMRHMLIIYLALLIKQLIIFSKKISSYVTKQLKSLHTIDINKKKVKQYLLNFTNNGN